MGRLQRTAAVLVLIASPSYASAASPEAWLGAAPPSVEGAAKSGNTTLPRIRRGPSAARLGATLARLQPDARSTTRGGAEVRVYQEASPSVVLVITDESLGSGALISADGKIITNLHVVGDAEEVGVIFKPKTEGDKVGDADVRTAKVIRRDAVTDLALLKVAEVPAGVKPLVVGGAADVQIGSDVHAIGHPTGQTWTYTRGIVSQIRKDETWSVEDKIEHRATLIQTQTPINPGNSGGPLLDDKLEIIGINSFVSDGEGLNFAVSGDDVKVFLTRTSDRLSAPVAVDPNCKMTVLLSERTTDPAGVKELVDQDCDGDSDFVFLLPDNKRDPMMALFDTDADGKVDKVVVDENGDGKLDYALLDTDGDGKPDMRGAIRKGESEPSRYEKIED
ncbi:MAG: trypsin-like peptidase domain-containing protein [Phenylobacterium sp.]|uniref:S1C family serine protease n=1 Tax=Phenylobacterium sp. TaxID=1871053 RepID=UPI002736D33D|nr:trypsin-like peptidase domain-containing protein [Phenylobacterium sp.]MDP3174266.1 trypsin-like peptidase domain-containing protein [Phenylobacterium sp.]